MSVRNLALTAAAVAVAAMGVYLFVAVRAAPIREHATVARHEPPTPRPPVRAAPAPSTPAARPMVRPAVREAMPPRVTRTPRLPFRPQLHPGGRALKEREPVNPKLDAVMDQANKAYDRQDFDEAMDVAKKVLRVQPDNVRMLRVMVSANCIAGDPAEAQQYFAKLPKFDREQMKARCDRYGVTFKDPPR